MIELLVEIFAGIIAEIAGEIVSQSVWYLAGFLWIKPPLKISSRQFYQSVDNLSLTDKNKENFIK